MSSTILILAQTRLDTHVPSYMRPAGTPGGSEATLGWWLLITAMAVVIIIAALVLWASSRGRSTDSGKHTNAPAEQGGGRPEWQIVSGVKWIYIGTAITIVILLIAFGGTLAVVAKASRPPSPPPIALDITAHQWWWEVRVTDSVPSNSFVTANEVHLPIGVPIRIRLRTDDVIHSFWVPELAGKMDVIPGQINETWLRADRAGVFRGACVEFCGLQHAHMAFAVVAESPAKYAAWAAQQRSEAALPAGAPTEAPTTAAATRQESNVVQAGEAVFVSSCGSCHAVRGTDALGRVGPDLTHIASRLTIGAGLVDNTTPNMISWVHNAQSMKPGVLMPPMDIPPSDVRAVVAYLQTLR